MKEEIVKAAASIARTNAIEGHPMSAPALGRSLCTNSAGACMENGYAAERIRMAVHLSCRHARIGPAVRRFEASPCADRTLSMALSQIGYRTLAMAAARLCIGTNEESAARQLLDLRLPRPERREPFPCGGGVKPGVGWRSCQCSRQASRRSLPI